jgi:hypothetical protein
MTKFLVEIIRTTSACHTFEVTANSLEEAEDLAYTDAMNHSWDMNDGDPTYEIDYAREADED